MRRSRILKQENAKGEVRYVPQVRGVFTLWMWEFLQVLINDPAAPDLAAYETVGEAIAALDLFWKHRADLRLKDRWVTKDVL